MGLGSLVQCQSHLVLLEVLLNAWVCHGHSNAAILGWAQLGHQSLGGFPFLQIFMGHFHGFWLLKEPSVFKGGMLVTNAFELVNFGAMLFVIHIPEPGNNMAKEKKYSKRIKTKKNLPIEIPRCNVPIFMWWFWSWATSLGLAFRMSFTSKASAVAGSSVPVEDEVGGSWTSWVKAAKMSCMESHDLVSLDIFCFWVRKNISLTVNVPKHLV